MFLDKLIITKKLYIVSVCYVNNTKVYITRRVYVIVLVLYFTNESLKNSKCHNKVAEGKQVYD